MNTTLPKSTMNTIHPCCLTIAGSDSGGNAGIQADLRMFHAYAIHGCSVVTALTAQNPFGVLGIHTVPAEFVADQLKAVLGLYDIRALKTGMLANSQIIKAVADQISNFPAIARIVDPVMVSTSGAKLIADEAIEALKKQMLPRATLVTPNIPEAEILACMKITCRADVQKAARQLYADFGCAILIKGGHAVGDLLSAEDTLYDGQTFTTSVLPWVTNPLSTHGTGCSLSAALAAELALGHDLITAVHGAKQAVHRAISHSYLVGENCGVLGWQ